MKKHREIGKNTVYMLRTLLLLTLCSICSKAAAQICASETIKVEMTAFQINNGDEALSGGPDVRITPTGTLNGTATTGSCYLQNNCAVSSMTTITAVNLGSVTIGCGASLPTASASFIAHEDDSFIDNCAFNGGDDYNCTGSGTVSINITNIRTTGTVVQNVTCGSEWVVQFKVTWTQNTVPNAPGGIANGLQLWMRADANAYSNAGTTLAVNNATIQQWNDQSANANQLAQPTAGSRPTYITGALNFNPVARFSGAVFLEDGTGTFGTIGNGAKEYFAVTNAVTNTASGACLCLSPSPAAANNNVTYGLLNNQGSGVHLTGASPFQYYKAVPSSGSVAAAHLYNTNSAAAATASAWDYNVDGQAAGTATTSGTSSAPTVVPTRVAIGAKYSTTAGSVEAPIAGDVAEVIFYNAQQVDRDRIASYLAIKYGITKSGNYVASDGSTNWTSGGGYDNAIAGIGQDMNTALNQKQSASETAGNTTGGLKLLSIALGTTVATTNAGNMGSFAADKTFLVWGADGGTTAFGSTAGALLRMNRVWFSKETKTVGNVRFRIAASVFNGATKHLVINATDPTFASGNTVVNLTLIGSYYEATVDMTSRANSTFYFSFAQTPAPTPGGVAGAGLWLKADVGITTGATMTWADQSGNNRNAVQSTAVNQPTVNSSLINFNPSLVLDGTNDFMPLQNLTGLPTGAAAVELFGVARHLNTADPLNHIISYGGNTATTFITLGKQAATANALTAFNTNDAVSTALEFAGGTTAMLDGKYTGANGVISSFGTQRTATANFTATKTTANGNVGTDPASTLANCWNGNISETILFPGNLTTTQVNQVNSYLAIKYGTTKAGNYLASDGTTTTWTSGGGYDSEIAGIAQDMGTEMVQKQSASESATNLTGGNRLLTIALGNSVAASNTLNTNTFLADKTFLVWGSNAGLTTFATALAVPAGAGNRMARVWKATETLTVGNSTFRIPLSVMNGSSRYLVINNTDATFASGNTFYPLSQNGSFLTAAVDLTSRAGSNFFFTFAQTPVPGPGGLTSNLQVWLKADAATFSDAGTTEATNNGTVQQWLDQSANGNTLEQATAAERPVWIQNNLNFNPLVRFAGAQSLIDATPTIGTVGNAAKEFFVVSTNVTNTGNGVFLNLSPNPAVTGNNISYGAISNTGTGVLTSGVTVYNTMRDLPNAGDVATPHVFNTNSAASTAMSAWTYLSDGMATGTATVSGTDATPNVTATNILIGAKNATSGLPNGLLTGDIAEVIFYNAQQADRDRIQSYLAIKYGLTLGTTASLVSYKNSGGAIVWTGDATFQNDIAGIGADDLSGLFQKQSASVNASNITASKNILAIALGSFAATNAANGNTFSADKTFLVTGNNAATTAFGGTVAGAGGILHMNRIWLAKETATVGTTKFRVPASLFGTGTPYMYLSNDGATFSTADQQVAMTAVGDYYEATVDLTGRAGTSFHFTFAELNALPVTLTLAMTASPATVTPTAALQYVVTLANTSANTAYNVKIKDQIPAGVTVGSVVPSVGTWDAATKIWTVPTLGPSPATATLTINTVVQ